MGGYQLGASAATSRLDLADLSVPQRQTSILIPLVGVLSALLTLLSPYYLYHAPAQPIISNLLLPQWAHRLNTYLSGANNELILVSLKLFHALSCFANGRERKSLFEVFAWEAKVRISPGSLTIGGEA